MKTRSKSKKHDPNPPGAKRALAAMHKFNQLAKHTPRRFGKNPALAAPYGMAKDDPANPYDEAREAKRLSFRHGVWGKHPDHPVEDWQYAVANGDTRRGYWEWVADRIVNKLPVAILVKIPARHR